MAKRNSRSKCDSGKVGYKSHRRAMMAIQRAKAVFPDSECYPERAYHCPRCDRWHLTSQPKEG